MLTLKLGRELFWGAVASGTWLSSGTLVEIWCLCPAPVSRAVGSGFAIQPLPRNTLSMKILQHLLFPQTFLPGNLFARTFEESKQRNLHTNRQGWFFSQYLTHSNSDTSRRSPRSACELPCSCCRYCCIYRKYLLLITTQPFLAPVGAAPPALASQPLAAAGRDGKGAAGSTWLWWVSQHRLSLTALEQWTKKRQRC